MFRLTSPTAIAGRQGFTLASVAVLIGIIMVFGLALVASVMYSNQTGQHYTSAISAEQIAEAGVDKALYCFKATTGGDCGGSYGSSYTGESNVSVGEGEFTTTISGSSPTWTITSEGTDATGRSQTVEVEVSDNPPDDSPDFSHALQAGQDGIYMENNATVEGSVYSAGNVGCQGTNAKIDGDVYVSLAGGRISGCTVEYDAHADSVLNADVGGDAYYNADPAGIAGSTVTGSTFANSSTPEPISLPGPDLDFWRSAAAAGGTISGNYAPSDGETMGPIKIEGNLTLSQNVVIIVNGPIWVTGTLHTKNNSGMQLHTDFQEYGTVVLADDPDDQVNNGQIDMVPNSSVSGTGDPKSHILLISTNTSSDHLNPAIMVANNAASAVFLATNGVMRLRNGASAKSIAARKLYLDQNAVVTYDAGAISDIKFANSPSTSWWIKRESWRQL